MDPGTYGGRYHPQLGPIEPELDTFELAVARMADARDLPILAICRGAQLLNVARGGDLYQHLPEDAGDQIDHRLPGKGQHAGHEVTDRGRLTPRPCARRRLRGAASTRTTTRPRIGSAAASRAVAWAPDGVIEGIEITDREFALGVQWHAEAIVEQAEQLQPVPASSSAPLGATAASGLRRAA